MMTRCGGAGHNAILSVFVKSYIFVLHVQVCCLHACMYTIVAQCPKRSEGGIRCPGTEVTDDHEPIYGCWERKLSPLQELQKLLSTEPPLLPSASFWSMYFKFTIVDSVGKFPLTLKMNAAQASKSVCLFYFVLFETRLKIWSGTWGVLKSTESCLPLPPEC